VLCDLAATIRARRYEAERTASGLRSVLSELEI
jgi:hypothetical protein